MRAYININQKAFSELAILQNTKIDTETREIVLKSILETSPTSFCKKEQI